MHQGTSQQRSSQPSNSVGSNEHTALLQKLLNTATQASSGTASGSSGAISIAKDQRMSINTALTIARLEQQVALGRQLSLHNLIYSQSSPSLNFP